MRSSTLSRTTPVPAVAVLGPLVLVGALAACTSTAPAPGGTGAIPVAAGDTSCEVAAAEACRTSEPERCQEDLPNSVLAPKCAVVSR